MFFRSPDPSTTARILVSSGIGASIGHAVDEGFFNIEEKTGEMFDFALAYLKAPVPERRHRTAESEGRARYF